MGKKKQKNKKQKTKQQEQQQQQTNVQISALKMQISAPSPPDLLHLSEQARKPGWGELKPVSMMWISHPFFEEH